MQYVGMDVHKMFIYACVLDEEGKMVFEQKFKTEPDDMDRFLIKIGKEDKITLEACSCWQYAYDYITEAGYTNVVLANPLQVKWIANSRKKTDKNDAKILAELLRTNLLPTSYAPPEGVREQRQITRHRASLVTIRTEVKNKIHAILRRHGYFNADDVFTNKGREYLKSIDLPSVDRHEMDQYVELIETLNLLINQTQEAIEEKADVNPQSKILTTMPGLDDYSALMITAEIGDIRRFSCSDKLVSYAGLNPSVYQSGNTTRTGHISKQGNKNLRWILTQCANVAVRHDKKLGEFYRKLKERKGHNIAIVATAKKMLRYIWVMLQHNITYPTLQVPKALAFDKS